MSSSSSTTHISIFDIPHILDQVCDELSKHQLFTCLNVSRTWCALFTPQVLRHVCFSNLESHQTWAILHRVSRIRSLTVDISNAAWLLKNPVVTVPCNNLRELHCLDFNYQPMRNSLWSHYYTPPSIVDRSSNALCLIASNPKMHTLTVENIPRRYQTYHFTEDVFRSIYNHGSLTNMKIHLTSAPYGFSGIFLKSLPAGIRDFELSVKRWSDHNRWSGLDRRMYPKEGFPWQQEQEQEQDENNSLLSRVRALKLERLALGGLQSGSTAAELATEPTREPPPIVIDGIELNDDPNGQFWYYSVATTGVETVKAFAERASGLRHLVVKDYLGSWSNILQVLLDNCPNLETIELTGNSYYNLSAHSNRADTQLQGYFAALREFRMTGAISKQMYTMISNTVVRSSATLEVVWINCSNWEWSEEEIRNAFHIGTSTSWTQCTLLKELGLHRNGGLSMVDPC
ncbi:hypothetical protein BGZ95_001843 [Linnemannia exigua]|uniref:F-box domain-containing protein n=1 Tax=Linnemannia exigua TaxID=604196 RepID=A0AAD4DIQ9_9FUNG|nr:hypothetical protein BGZ95_001843 [Linnemannia exigua]